MIVDQQRVGVLRVHLECAGCGEMAAGLHLEAIHTRVVKHLMGWSVAIDGNPLMLGRFDRGWLTLADDQLAADRLRLNFVYRTQ